MQTIETIYNRFAQTKLVRTDEELNGNGIDILNQAFIRFSEKYEGMNVSFMPEKSVIYELRNLYRNERFKRISAEKTRSSHMPTISADAVNAETETSVLDSIPDTSSSKKEREKRRADLIKLVRNGIRSNRVFKVVYGYVFEGKTFDALGTEMGVSRFTVSRLFNQGVELLKSNSALIDEFKTYRPSEFKGVILPIRKTKTRKPADQKPSICESLLPNEYKEKSEREAARIDAAKQIKQNALNEYHRKLKEWDYTSGINTDVQQVEIEQRTVSSDCKPGNGLPIHSLAINKPGYQEFKTDFSADADALTVSLLTGRIKWHACLIQAVKLNSQRFNESIRDRLYNRSYSQAMAQWQAIEA